MAANVTLNNSVGTQQSHMDSKKLDNKKESPIHDKTKKIFNQNLPNLIQEKKVTNPTEEEFYVKTIIEQKKVSEEVAKAEYEAFS